MSTFYNRTKSNKGIPVGTIIPWSGVLSDVPRGWLPCNGSESYNAKDYPILYNVIGNTYGGTDGLTFKVPRLNTGTATPVDMFKGHFYYLNSLGESQYNTAHKPEKTVINDDAFWQTVGGSNSGNSPSTTQSNWTSTIDVVGEQVNVETLVANYNDFVFNPGEVIDTVYISGRKLGDKHIPDHTHSYATADQNIGTGVSFGGSNAQDCKGGTLDNNFFCRLTSRCTCVTRTIPGGSVAPNLIGNDSGMRTLYNNYRTNAGLFAGGSGFGSRNTGETASRGVGLNYDGDGATAGDMWAHRNGTQFYWSSLDPGRQFSTFASVSSHSHGILQYTFSSKYIRIVNPGLINDVRLNTVTINNETGRNYGTITANTATPTLSMIYIIRAY